jgi:hypothetical protein
MKRLLIERYQAHSACRTRAAEEAERAVADALNRRTLEQSLRELQRYEDKREVRSSRKRA